MTRILLRPMQEDDRDHVVGSWLHSYSESQDAKTIAKLTGKSHLFKAYAALVDQRPVRTGDALPYFAFHRMLIQRLIESSDCTVACLEDEPTAIVGYRVSNSDILHYVRVQPAYRRGGVCRHLLRDLVERPVRFTHWTPDVTALAEKLPSKWSYEPALLKLM